MWKYVERPAGVVGGGVVTGCYWVLMPDARLLTVRLPRFLLSAPNRRSTPLYPPGGLTVLTNPIFTGFFDRAKVNKELTRVNRVNIFEITTKARRGPKAEIAF
jgi:hypothetical protein